MITVLTIIGMAVLLILLVVSVKRQLETRAAEKQAAARAYTGQEEAQHEDSLRRRAGVRTAHAERQRRIASDTEARNVGSDAD